MSRLSEMGVDADDDLTQLIHLARTGDRLALNSLLNRYRPYLRVVAEKLIRSHFRARFDGSDIVQEVCRDAAFGIKQLRASSEPEFNAWINRILKNNLANFLRDHTAAKRDVRLEQDVGDGNVSIQWRSRDASGRRPDSRLIQGEAALVLAQSLAGLPDDQRTAIQMRYIEMCKLAEIAEYMQISISSVARLIDQGLNGMKNQLPDDLC